MIDSKSPITSALTKGVANISRGMTLSNTPIGTMGRGLPLVEADKESLFFLNKFARYKGSMECFFF